MTTVFKTPQQLLTAGLQRLGTSGWLAIDENRVRQFAEITGDRSWLDPEPSNASDAPDALCTVQHALVLSLVNAFLPQILEVRGAAMGVNVGCGKVRFPTAVRIGARIRGHGELIEAKPVTNGVQAIVRITVEIEGSPGSACIADTISRYLYES
jgi:acyl dehydratase